MYFMFCRKGESKDKVQKITCKHIVIFYIDLSTLYCSGMEGGKQGAVFSVIFKMPSVCVTVFRTISSLA